MTGVLLVTALLAGLAAAFLAFAQHALLAAVADRDLEALEGEDYADLAMVTRLMERPRAVHLQLSALRTALRWLAIASAAALAVPAGTGAVVGAALAAAFLMYVFEEELPIRLVLRDPVAWALRLLPPLELPLRLLRTFGWVFDAIDNACRVIVRSSHRREPPLSVEELTMMAASGGADLGVEERRMLRGIFRSSGILVADIMTPRDRVAALEASGSVADALAAFRSTRHSRLPVFEGTLDRVIGMAHAKDFLRLAFDADRHAAPVVRQLRDAYFVRQDRRIHELFEELREGRIHLAVVVDRLGRTTGIVSLDDILEEIVGELHDDLEAVAAR
jgi:CBS domain containing-hemolysin-like protein